MWKKLETIYSENSPRQASAPATRGARAGSSQAVVGPSISIRGDLSGDEDLLIQGRVEGTIELKQHSVTVGPDGVVKADVFGQTICIEGKLKGNLHGDEQVIIRSSGDVRGNIVAPRVVLEDGALFKGSIDMEPRRAEKIQPATQTKLGVTPAKEPAGQTGIGKDSTTSVSDQQIKSA